MPFWIEIDGVLYCLPMPTTRRPQYTSEETSWNAVSEGVYCGLPHPSDAVTRSSLMALLYQICTNTRRARRAPNKHYEIPFVRRIPCSSNLLRNAITRSSLVAVFYSLNIQNTETSNMFLNKHYEIPFVKECVARFPLPYSVKTRHRLHSITSNDPQAT